MPGLSIGDDRHVIRFEPREVSDILALGDGREGEKAFEVVRHVAEMNQAMYDRFVSPVVQMFSNEMTATCLRNLNQSRLERTLFSDSNPFLKALKPVAELIRTQRKPVAPDNRWLKVEQQNSASLREAWDKYRDTRDAGYEKLFRAVYESPLLAQLVGFKPEPEKKTRLQHGMAKKIRERQLEHEHWFDQGTLEHGFLRLLIFVASGNGVVDERPFNGIKRLMKELGPDKTISLQQLKDDIRKQTFLVRRDEQRALNGLVKLLPTEAERMGAYTMTRDLLQLSGPISAEKEGRLQRVADILGFNAAGTSPPQAESVTEKLPARKRKITPA